ncbi:Mur ligase [Pavlovales sp. CCMP2436]|nr:Mur ligase [Pavlovales sp. CCMP2436]
MQEGLMEELTYRAAVQYLFANAGIASAPGLRPADYWRRFDRLLDALGRPERAQPGGCAVVHVAGTNGKGTTTALCDALLRGAGVGPVGLFTSPHLHCWRERIRVDGRLATQEEVTAGVRLLRAAEPELARALHAEAKGAAAAEAGAPGEAMLTPFEKLTALALLVFRAAGVRWLVLETGLGGRWDCTNQLIADRAERLPVEGDAELSWPASVLAAGAPAAAVGICRVGMDHMNVLGGTLAAIAAEKAGILKRGVSAFSVPQPVDADSVLRATAARRGALLAFPQLDDADFCRALALAAADGPAASTGARAAPGALVLPRWLQSAHQQHNLLLAISLVRSALSQAGDAHGEGSATRAGGLWTQPTVDAALRAGLATIWPGRLETLSLGGGGGGGGEGPARSIMLDCAHNEDALRALLEHLGAESVTPTIGGSVGELPGGGLGRGLSGEFGGGGSRPALTLVFGTNRDKDVATLLRLIGHFATDRARAGPRVRAVHLVASAHPKSCAADALLEAARAQAPDVPWCVVSSVAAAVDLAAGQAVGSPAPSSVPPTLAELGDYTLVVGSTYVVAEARARIAQTHPAALRADDWVHEILREPDLGVLAVAI